MVPLLRKAIRRGGTRVHHRSSMLGGRGAGFGPKLKCYESGRRCGLLAPPKSWVWTGLIPNTPSAVPVRFPAWAVRIKPGRAALLDHLVGHCQHGLRNLDAEAFRGL